MLRNAMLSFAHVHAKGYARQVNDNPDAMIQCVWDNDLVRGQLASKQYDVPYIADLEAVVSSLDVDAVVVNRYTSQHPWVMKAALKHKNIFSLRKPSPSPPKMLKKSSAWLKKAASSL